MSPAMTAHCATRRMSSAGSPSFSACRWASQKPTPMDVAMRMPYHRTVSGPSSKAIAPGEAITSDPSLSSGKVSSARSRASGAAWPRPQSEAS